MLIELFKGMPLHPGTLNAAPEKVMISALNSNTDLKRFLFLHVIGNYSLLLSSISWSSKNFEVRMAFAIHHLFMILEEAGLMVELLEHDPTLFPGVETMMPHILGMLKEPGREPLVLLYAPSSDRSSTVLMRQTDLKHRDRND
jgi:hypothetical protein